MRQHPEPDHLDQEGHHHDDHGCLDSPGSCSCRTTGDGVKVLHILLAKPLLRGVLSADIDQHLGGVLEEEVRVAVGLGVKHFEVGADVTAE